MKRLLSYSSIILLTLLAACAPVAYHGSYSQSYPQASTVYVQHQNSYRAPAPYNHRERVKAIYRGEERRYGDLIEVTLYPGQVYASTYRYSNQSVTIRIADGDLVRFPVHDKRGLKTNLYAHYTNNNLHFDIDLSCNRLHSSISYNLDQSWEVGRRYSKIAAGGNYDFKDSHLRIHAVPVPGYSKHKHVARPLQDTKVIVHKQPQKQQYKSQDTIVTVKQSGKSHVQQVRVEQPKSKKVVKAQSQPNRVTQQVSVRQSQQQVVASQPRQARQKVAVYRDAAPQRQNKHSLDIKDRTRIKVGPQPVKPNRKRQQPQVTTERQEVIKNQRMQDPEVISKDPARQQKVKTDPRSRKDQKAVAKQKARSEVDVVTEDGSEDSSGEEASNHGKQVSAQKRDWSNGKDTEVQEVLDQQQGKVNFGQRLGRNNK